MRELARMLRGRGFGIQLEADGNTFRISHDAGGKKVPLVFNRSVDDLINAAHAVGFVDVSFSLGGRRILFKHKNGLLINAAVKGAKTRRVSSVLIEAPRGAELPQEFRNHVLRLISDGFDSPALRLERELSARGTAVSFMKTGALKVQPSLGRRVTVETIFGHLNELPNLELVKKTARIDAVEKTEEKFEKQIPVLSAEFDALGHLRGITLHNVAGRETSLSLFLNKVLTPPESKPGTAAARRAAKIEENQ